MITSPSSPHYSSPHYWTPEDRVRRSNRILAAFEGRRADGEILSAEDQRYYEACVQEWHRWKQIAETA